jgi:site-specific DNA-methyltransferase (adenine-specific)
MVTMARYPDKWFDLAIVDPPYGIGMGKTHTGKGWVVRENKEWDKESPDKDYFLELKRISKNQIIWGANYFTEFLSASMGWIFWDKGQRNFSLADGELAYTSFNQALRVFEMSRGKMQGEQGKEIRFHPTQKPVKLYDWLLHNYAKPGQRILDTHGGSMSSAIACHYFGCDLVLCELDKDYFDAGCNRFKLATAQVSLFEAMAL